MFSAQALSFIVNHVVLPPKLPQTADEPGTHEQEGTKALLRLVSDCAEDFSDALEPAQREGWNVVKSMLHNFEKIYLADYSQVVLKQILNEMAANDVRAFALEEQNAALFIQRTEQDFTFSCFEISALAENVMKANGALIWTFPGRSVSVHKDIILQDCFMEQLTLKLHQLSQESIQDMQQVSTKSGSRMTEIRDTPDPAMVTDMLMALLAGYGSISPVSGITKRIRDERLHSDTFKNWSRSPIWTSIKISAQLACMHHFAGNHHIPYKNFMCLLLSRIVKLSVSEHHGVDSVYAATAKLLRRALKLGKSLYPKVQTVVKEAMHLSQTHMEGSWSTAQDQHRKQRPRYDWKFTEDMTLLGLENCRDALEKVLQRDIAALPREAFHPNCSRRLYCNDGLPVVQFSGADMQLHLFDLEQWVEVKLPAREFGRSEDSLRGLLSLLETYTKAALDHYKGLPDQLSIMILTAVEIWVVMDKIAIEHWPILKDYQPEIPTAFLEPCLLKERSQMQRLQAIETYLAARCEHAGTHPVFETNSAKCLSVRYFDQSQHHQNLRHTIEKEARRLWAEKQAEWSRKTAKHEQLISQATAMECSYWEDREGFSRHDRDCEKCRLSKEAKNLQIEKYEWPLPQHENALKTAVFELDVPDGLGAWRAASWKIAHDLGRQEPVPGEPCEGTLHRFAGLTAFAVRRDDRLALASNTKSVQRSHYRTCKFPVDVDSLLVNHGQHYALYDSKRSEWVDAQTQRPNIWRFCRTVLPKGPYKYLQYAVDGTSHTPNRVIATQNDAVNLDLHEHHAFASLRAGRNLQWLQISQALVTPDLSLHKEETALLIQHAALQAGPRRDAAVLRQAHRVLEDDNFVGELLENIRHRFESIRANWKEGNAMLMLISLTLRVRSVAANDKLADRAKCLLRNMQHTALLWTRELNILRQSDERDPEHTSRNHLLRAAFASKATFGEEGLLTPADEDAVAAYVEASIYLSDNKPAITSDLPKDLTRLAYQDQRLSHRVELVLRHAVNKYPAGISKGVNAYCSRFSLNKRWSCLEAPNERWTKTSITANSASDAIDVYLNLLTGELLVNGSPLGRLPGTIKEHHMYRRVFGQFDPQVMISEISGLDYVTVAPLHKQYLYFSRRGEELIVQTRSADRTLELLPHTLFSQDLPANLVDSATHWIDAQQKIIEIRPLENIWTASQDNWKLIAARDRWQALRYQERLVDRSSSFYKDAVGIMGPIEEAKHVIITASEKGILQATLPRYNLRFFVNTSQELECRERRAIVDSNQEIGCFIGLRSYLVLRNIETASRTFKRQLIVPRGKIHVVSIAEHVDVSIDTGLEPTVPHSTFIVDTILNRIQTDGVLDGLFKAHLHAITSFVLPDPLTGRTGTEEALSYLRKVHLLEPANTDIVEVLESIKGLSPKRSYYPEHLHCMQRIMWHPQLSPHSQHEEFETLAKQIYDKADRLTVFYDGVGQQHCLYNRSKKSLIDRAAARNATFRTQVYGGAVQSRGSDAVYSPRDRRAWDQRSMHVFEISSLLHSWRPMTAIIGNLPSAIQELRTVSGFLSDFKNDCPELLTNMLHLCLASNWGSLFNMCRKTSKCESPRVAFILGLLAFGGVDVAHLRTLAAIAISQAFAEDGGFSDNSFQLYMGTAPSNDFLMTIKGFTSVIPLSKHEKRIPEKIREHSENYELAKKQSEAVHKHLVSQWPTASPVMPTFPLTCLQANPLFNTCRVNFKSWYANRSFVAYLEKVQRRLEAKMEKVGASRYLEERNCLAIFTQLRSWNQPYPEFDPRACTRHSLRAPPSLKYKPESRLVTPNAETTELSKILSSLQRIDSEYASDLSSSLESYLGSQVPVIPAQMPIALKVLQYNYQAWGKLVRQRVNDFVCAYRSQLRPELLADAWVFGARITIDEILRYLAAACRKERSASAVLHFGSEIASLQRCQRMITLAVSKDIANFVKEAEHGDQRPWNIQLFPEWLALELENDMGIRQLQARVAQEMNSPSSGENSTLQLNMGEGKSAVIVHMIAATLAEKGQLCRLLVLKPLMRQMMALLIKRHQGIAARPLYYLPFSRETQMTPALLDKMITLWTECRDAGGILLVQPEHMLSFKLMGIERLSADPYLGRQLFEAYQNHRKMSRDVLDESDEILSTTFQLVYAIGTQKHLEGYPDRWTCQASLLDRVEDALKSSCIDGLTSHSLHDGSFPRITFKRRSAGERLVRDVTTRLMVTGAPRLTFDILDTPVQKSIMRFFAENDISETDWTAVNTHFNDHALRNLLLLRGLIAGGILLHGLQAKRWLVNYGLDLGRSKMAVPYNAKRVPSPRSEFGHPDVGVLFTYLSYYYDGLNEAQLKQTFEMLYRSPDPSQEYSSWAVRSSTLPANLRDLRSVNLEDPLQFSLQLVPALQYNKKTIDFYLAQVVYPSEAKEFSQKLSTSAWDIPAESGSAITTGFSGTNDNKSLLPKSIRQSDLDELRGTNAMVMSYLLLPENRACRRLHRPDGKSPELADLTDLLLEHSQRPQVLIDVGALIIESENEEVAIRWLEREPDMEAALFFDSKHEMIVIDREGRRELFQSSPYKDCLNKCLVYLDEYHTRGTDLKLPPDARAAVTISPWLTKDRLVQACMRMRRLGHGQSLFFIINEEVTTSIVESSSEPAGRAVDSRDILRFCLSRTCADNERLRPLWAAYGINHRLRHRAASSYNTSPKTESADKTLLDTTLESDARSLTQLYAPSVAQERGMHHSLLKHDSEVDVFIQDLQRYIDRLPRGVAERTMFNEEQEREVDQEREQMEEKQRPPNMEPLPHAISSGLRDFIRTGRVPLNCIAGASAALDQTSFSGPESIKMFGHLRLTEDFLATIKLNANDTSDYYLRPPTYVLTSHLDPMLVLISPFEADQLFWEIKASRCVSLRVYAPRSMKSMRGLDTSGLHTFGGDPRRSNRSWTAEQRRSLNLFGGQLYFDSLEEYNALRQYFSELKKASNGADDPQALLSHLAGVRRKGKPFTLSHLDKLVNGRTLTAEEV